MSCCAQQDKPLWIQLQTLLLHMLCIMQLYNTRGLIAGEAAAYDVEFLAKRK